MVTTPTPTLLPPLAEPHQRETVGHELEPVLHDHVAMSLIGKQLHRAMGEPVFRPVNLHIAELVDAWWDLAARVAERAIAREVTPDGQATAVTAGSERTPVTATPSDGHVAVRDRTQWMLRAQLGEYA